MAYGPYLNILKNNKRHFSTNVEAIVTKFGRTTYRPTLNPSNA